MKSFGLIALLISLVIAAVLGLKQKKTTVKMTTVAPSGKEVQVSELPNEVKNELDSLNQKADKRFEEGQQED